MASDLLLIRNIQRGVDVDDSVKELTSLHSGICFQQIHRFNFPTGSYMMKKDLLQEKELFIFEAAKSYKEDRGTKFSTWLGDTVRWTISKRIKQEVKNEMAAPLTEEDPPAPWKAEAVDEVMKFLRANCDKTTVKIFKLRYLKPTNGDHLTSWHDIADELGYSHEWMRGLHNEAILKIKEHFKSDE